MTRKSELVGGDTRNGTRGKSRPTPSSPSRPDPITILRKISPPDTVIHIGAGSGAGEMHQWRHWPVSHAWIIDADSTRLKWTEDLAEQHSGWQAVSAVLSDAEGEAEYHQASNPDEDGLIPAEMLAALWPNLRTIAQEPRPTQRLDTVLAGTSMGALVEGDSRVGALGNTTWVLIDCLPALSILNGAGRHLDQWSVIWLRTRLHPITDGAQSELDEIEAYLAPHGYRCVDVAEANHPGIGYALFARDWQSCLSPKVEALASELKAQDQEKLLLKDELKALAAARDDLISKNAAAASQAEQFKTERDAQAKLANERQAQTAVLIQQRDAHAHQAVERKKQIEVLNQANKTLSEEKANLITARDEAAKKLSEMSGWAEQLKKERDAQAQLANERLAQTESLAQQRDAHAHQAAERQSQVESLNQALIKLDDENKALTASCNELQKQMSDLTAAKDEANKNQAVAIAQFDKLKAECDVQAKLAAERLAQTDRDKAEAQQKDAHIAKLESDIAEYATRQRMIEEEMTRAEGQIDLIKDVLLREPGL